MRLLGRKLWQERLLSLVKKPSQEGAFCWQELVERMLAVSGQELLARRCFSLCRNKGKKRNTASSGSTVWKGKVDPPDRLFSTTYPIRWKPAQSAHSDRVGRRPTTEKSGLTPPDQIKNLSGSGPRFSRSGSMGFGPLREGGPICKQVCSDLICRAISLCIEETVQKCKSVQNHVNINKLLFDFKEILIRCCSLPVQC